MATRTIKLLGEAFAASGNVTLNVSAAGSSVHAGTVTTTAGSPPELGTYTDSKANELVSFTQETGTTAGTLAVSVTASGGDVILTEVKMTHVDSTGAETIVGKDAGQIKENVTVDGTLQAVASDQAGELHWLIEDGSTVTFNLGTPAYADEL